MPSYWQLLLLILPVFALIAIGVLVRRAHWVGDEAETSLIRLVVNLCYPALIFESVSGNAALRQAENVVLPPVAVFLLTVGGIALSYYLARLLGLTVGTGLRTFAISAGVANYGYLPLPIMEGMWGAESRGVLLVHNLGVEVAIWTVGILLLSGSSLREGWKKLASPIILTLLLAVILNLSGLTPLLPKLVMDLVHALAVCAIPLGLLMTGVNLANYLGEPQKLFAPTVTLGGWVVRLALLPLGFITIARVLPGSIELKRVLVVQAAMPSAVIPIILARYYGGQPLTAVQVVLGTTALGIFTIPLWLRLGLSWIGGD